MSRNDCSRCRRAEAVVIVRYHTSTSTMVEYDCAPCGIAVADAYPGATVTEIQPKEPAQ